MKIAQGGIHELLSVKNRDVRKEEFLLFFDFVQGCVDEFDKLASLFELRASHGYDIQHVAVETSACTYYCGGGVVVINKKHLSFSHSSTKTSRNAYVYVRVTSSRDWCTLRRNHPVASQYVHRTLRKANVVLSRSIGK